MKLKSLIFSSLFIIGIAFYFYVKNNEDTQQIHYITEPVARITLDKNVLATGSVRASQRTEVGAQVSGKIISLNVKLGQAVKKGDLIAEIDASNQNNTLSTAEANLTSYQAKLKSAQVALDIAMSNYNRLVKLYKTNSTSLTELDTAKNTLASAKASVDEVKAQIKSAEISVNDAKTNLNYTQILSPMDGIIVSVPVSVGQTVNSNQTSPTIVQVADLSKVLIKLEVSEGDIAQIKEGQRIQFTTLAEPNHPYISQIDTVDPALTTLTDNNYSEQSGNTEAIYYYANSLVDNPTNSLRIGMTVQGQINIEKRENILAVPTSTLKKRNKETVVMVLKNNQVEEKSVKIGLSDGQYTEIISDLEEGELVIVTQRSDQEKIGFEPKRRMF